MQTDDKKQIDQDATVHVNESNADKNIAYNKNTDKQKDLDSKTFNEDEASYDNKNKSPETAQNSGTPGNDWDANNPVERSDSYRYDDEQRNAADYINSDHSDYNRSNSRFYWDDNDF